LVSGTRPRPKPLGCAGRAHRIDGRGTVLHAARHGAGRPGRVRARPLLPQEISHRALGRRPGEMKESILDVLLYLFEHYFSQDTDTVRDRDSIQNGLLEAGFSPSEIHKAFDWLDALAQQRPTAD